MSNAKASRTGVSLRADSDLSGMIGRSEWPHPTWDAARDGDSRGWPATVGAGWKHERPDARGFCQPVRRILEAARADV